MKALWPLLFCLVLVACVSSPPQAAPTEIPVEVTTMPSPVATPAATQPDKQVKSLSSTGTDGLCSTAEMKYLAPMVLEMEGRRGLQLTLVDLANGLPSCDFKPLAVERNNQLGVSADGIRLAVITTDSDSFYNGKLLLVDLAGQKVYPTSVKVASWVSGMVFSPDGSRLALAYPTETTGLPVPGETRITLLVVSFGDQGKVIETTLPFGVRLLRFTRDGSALVVYGAPDDTPSGDYPTATAALLDASDLSLIWEQKLAQVKHGAIPMEGTTGEEYLMEYLEPAVVYAPQKNALYIVHAGEEELTRVDFTGRQVSTVEIRPRMSWIERLLNLFSEPAQAKAASGVRKQAVLSPDGKKLYVVSTREDVKIDEAGNITPLREPLGLRVLAPDSGEELDRIETGANGIGISPDGASLFLMTWGWGYTDGNVEVVSTKDMAVRGHFDVQQFLITLSPAGKPHLLMLNYGSSNTEVSYIDWDSLEPVGKWKMNGYLSLVSMP